MYPLLNTIAWDQINSWPQLEAAIAALGSEQDRGEAFEEFCYGYFTLESRLYQVKDGWRFRDVPRTILDRLGTATTQDKGIDGILLHEDGTITAYQSKFRVDRSTTPSQRELSTFYMVSDRADYRLVVSNVADLPSVVKERKDHGQILVDQLLDLDRTFFARLRELVLSVPLSSKQAIDPRPYQTEVLENIVRGFSDADRGQAILACGAGKTLVGKWVFDRLACQSALIMVPSLALIRQTLGEWHRASSTAFRYLCVCSDRTVDAQAEDSWVVYPSDLDCRVTTDAADVVAYLRAPSSVARAIFCTYQSGEVVSTALRARALSEFFFDLAICDEAHRLAGPSNKMFTHVLHDESIRVRKRLFMTATPRIVEPILKPDTALDDDVKVFSMDDASTFGRVFHRFGFRQAIKEKVICDYQIVVIGVSEEEATDHASLPRVVTTADAGKWNIEGLAQRIALGKAISIYLIRKIFSFHNRVESASRFVNDQLSDSFPAVMKQIAPEVEFMCSHISGRMPAGARAKILREFRSAPRGVVSNARCLGEGVNVPDVDGIFFSDPRESVVEIVQATGRALRRRPGKQTAYVIIPVLIRTGEDPEKLLKASRFDSVWKVLSAMMSQDERSLEATINALIAKGQEGELNIRERSPIKARELPDYRTILLGFPRDLVLSEYQRLFTLEAVERMGDRWYVRFGVLKRYMDLYGEEPTSQTEFQGVRLGSWLATQRAAFRKERLTPERLELLKELGVSLAQPAHRKRAQSDWEKSLIACKAFLEIHGRLPGAGDTSADGRKIGMWLAHQRVNNRKGKLSKDSATRFEEVLGAAWDPRAEQWDRNLQAYKDYVEKTGRQPDKRSVHSGVRIGNWLVYLRQTRNSLPEDKVSALNAIGMNWGSTRLVSGLSAMQLQRQFVRQTDDEWFRYYVSYKEFISGVAHSTPEAMQESVRLFTENALGLWFNFQKTLYEKNQLSEKRQRSINYLLHVIGQESSADDRRRLVPPS